MKGTWKKYKLGEIAILNYGKSLVTGFRQEGRVPVFSSSGISGYHNEALVDTEGIIVGRKGNVGSVYYSKEPFYCIDTAYYIKPDENYDLKFLYYKLISMNLLRLTSDSAVPGLNRETAYAQEILFPDTKEEQSQIASILSSLDDKIELNHQVNQTVEAMAQTLFKEWFFNFNFPGFDGELANGLPKGWRRGSVLDVVNLLSGGTPRTEVKEYWEGDIKWISARDITEYNGGFIVDTEKKITKEGLKNSAAKVLPALTTVISARGTVGNYCILPEEMTISQSNYGLKAKVQDNDFFVFLLVKSMIDMMQQYSYGTVFDTITTKTFKEIEVILPDEKVALEFNELAKPLFEKILLNTTATQVLKAVRDSLLPKLMSGKIEIKV